MLRSPSALHRAAAALAEALGRAAVRRRPRGERPSPVAAPPVVAPVPEPAEGATDPMADLARRRAAVDWRIRWLEDRRRLERARWARG